MSIAYCEKHSIKWDSDAMLICPECEHEIADYEAAQEAERNAVRDGDKQP